MKTYFANLNNSYFCETKIKKDASINFYVCKKDYHFGRSIKLCIRSANLDNFRYLSLDNYNFCYCLNSFKKFCLSSPNDIMHCFVEFASPINHFYYKYIFSSFSRIITSFIFSFLKYELQIIFAISFTEE